VVTCKKWMDMTPKKEVRVFRLRCYVCEQEIEVFSDEVYKITKCFSCKAAIDPNKCQVIQVH
jgi:hypothetical protein